MWKRKHLKKPYLTSDDKEKPRYQSVPPGYASGTFLLESEGKPSFNGRRSPSSPDSEFGPPLSPSETMPNSYSSRANLAAAMNSVSASSTHSLLAPHRKRYSSVPSNSSSAGSIYGAPTSATRSPRLSGAPHSPFSRIDIVPPQPLGAPPGSIIQTDRSTLAFSTKSGISGDDEERLFNADTWKPSTQEEERQQKAKEFAEAKAAYLVGTSSGSSVPMAVPRHASRDSAGFSNHCRSASGGPFGDSAEYQDYQPPAAHHEYRPASNEIRSLSPNDTASFLAEQQERRAATPEGSARWSRQQRGTSLASTQDDEPTSPLEKLRNALQAGGGHIEPGSSSSDEHTNSSEAHYA